VSLSLSRFDKNAEKNNDEEVFGPQLPPSINSEETQNTESEKDEKQKNELREKQKREWEFLRNNPGTSLQVLSLSLLNFKLFNHSHYNRHTSVIIVVSLYFVDD
jgi:hypothetical protein